MSWSCTSSCWTRKGRAVTGFVVAAIAMLTGVVPCATARGPGNWFSGEVWIDPIASGHGPPPLSLGNVHFTPGARTAWHSHSTARTLCVSEGEGLVQSRGEAIIRIRPGDIVRISGGEWHWHGATPGHFMTHLSLTEGDTARGEHVTNTEYHSGGTGEAVAPATAGPEQPQ